jgi:hypothetical protein
MLDVVVREDVVELEDVGVVEPFEFDATFLDSF